MSVAPSGELDLVTAPALRAALEAAAGGGARRIVVTLGEVTFLDSTALGAIVHGWRQAADLGIEFSLTGASPGIRRILAVTGLEDLLDE